MPCWQKYNRYKLQQSKTEYILPYKNTAPILTKVQRAVFSVWPSFKSLISYAWFLLSLFFCKPICRAYLYPCNREHTSCRPDSLPQSDILRAVLLRFFMQLLNHPWQKITVAPRCPLWTPSHSPHCQWFPSAGFPSPLSQLHPLSIPLHIVSSDKSCKVLIWIISDFFQGTHW